MRLHIIRARQRDVPAARPRRTWSQQVVHALGEFVVGVMLVCILLTGLLYVRLTQGPVSLGPIASNPVATTNSSR